MTFFAVGAAVLSAVVVLAVLAGRARRRRGKKAVEIYPLW